MHMIYLRYEGYGPGDCAGILDVHPNTITTWTKLYIQGGLSLLGNLNYQIPQSELVAHKEEIVKSFDQHPPQTIAQAAERIKEISGLERSLGRIGVFMKLVLHLKRRKLQPLPGGKKSIDKLIELQKQFLEKELNPLLEKALAGHAEVFFVDAVHPVMGFHSTHIWSQSPRQLRTSNGRYRINILGALHAINKGLYSISNDTYINSQTVDELMAWIRENIPRGKIYLIMDNARYQRCDWVKQKAKKRKIELVFLPAYSPNLNLIERLWKYFKKEALAGKHFQSKQEFTKAIFDFIDQIDQGLHQAKLETLLRLKFQTLNSTDKEFSQNLAA